MVYPPLISVLLPVYNATRWIDACLYSLLNQSFSAYEIIVVDDGSTDGTADAVMSLAKAHGRVRLHRLSVHQGIVGALNYGLTQCNGDFVARMDGDDLCSSDRLWKQYSFLIHRTDIDLVGSQTQSIDENGRVWSRSAYPTTVRAALRALPFSNPIPHPAWMVRKSAFERLSGYRDLAPVEDYDFLMRLYRSGGRFLNHPDVLVQRRIHAANSRSVFGLKQLLARRHVYRAVMGGYALTKANLDSLCHVDVDDQRRYAEASEYLTGAIFSQSLPSKTVKYFRAAFGHREVARYLLERLIYKLVIRGAL